MILLLLGSKKKVRLSRVSKIGTLLSLTFFLFVYINLFLLCFFLPYILLADTETERYTNRCVVGVAGSGDTIANAAEVCTARLLSRQLPPIAPGTVISAAF